MSTLIVPCLGSMIINNLPQYLHRHPKGKLLIEHSIEGICANLYDKILIVLLESDVEKYQADTFIKDELKEYPIEIITLNEMTSGPAETVYLAIQKANIKGPIVIKDVDNYLLIDNIPKGNFVAGLDLNTWERDVYNLRSKSFLILNEQGNLLDIIEKQIKSDVICLGLYGFSKAGEFIKAYNKLNDVSYPISKLYISHIISYLIGYSGRLFRYVPVSKYENWSKERLWKDMQRDYALYFIDLDNILRHNGILSEESKNKLLALQARGASFVGYTVSNKEYMKSSVNNMKSIGLNFIDIIYNCPFSEKKIVIDCDDDLTKKFIEL